MPIDKVVIQLHSKGAPSEVLSKYLGFIDNQERRMALAQQLGCHKTVIDVGIIFRLSYIWRYVFVKRVIYFSRDMLLFEIAKVCRATKLLYIQVLKLSFMLREFLEFR